MVPSHASPDAQSPRGRPCDTPSVRLPALSARTPLPGPPTVSKACRIACEWLVCPPPLGSHIDMLRWSLSIRPDQKRRWCRCGARDKDGNKVIHVTARHHACLKRQGRKGEKCCFLFPWMSVAQSMVATMRSRPMYSQVLALQYPQRSISVCLGLPVHPKKCHRLAQMVACARLLDARHEWGVEAV